MQARIEVATGRLIAFGQGLAEPETGEQIIVELNPVEEIKLSQPGIKTLGPDGVITVTAAPPEPEPLPVVDPADTELDAAITTATTLEGLKAALLGSRGGRVKARPGA